VLASHILIRTKDTGCMKGYTSPSFFYIKYYFKIRICMTGWEKSRVQGKNDYISIETGDSKHEKEKMNERVNFR
jgi:hypothetical protein